MKLTKYFRINDYDKGFSTAWMLGLAFLILLVGLAFFTFSGALSARQQLVSIADRAANAGATAIDEDVLVSSDGDDVFLDPAPDPDPDGAVTRCLEVIRNSNPKARIVSTETGCQINNADPGLIEVRVTGEVDYGIMARWLGSEKGKFTITSSARPSCSDGSC